MTPPPSIVISRLLNDLGYSYENIVQRQRMVAAIVIDFMGFHTFLCGSKREGITLPCENDNDCMNIMNSFECFDSEVRLRNSVAPIKFMLTKLRNTASGYFLLKMISPQNSDVTDLVQQCLVDIYGGYFLSSDYWKQEFKEKMMMVFSLPEFKGIFEMSRDSQGPSNPGKFLYDLMSFDSVIALQCDCRYLITDWKNRRRPHDWPSKKLINEVSSLQAHMVPVGYKGSQTQDLEWRICYTLGEIRLMESLNECQIKLVILLKMIAKEELKPICQDMSSYVMKNLVFWLAESFPSEKFQECNLIEQLINSLKLLKHCIIYRNLPSYMIERRNLFADRISAIEGTQLCQKIDACLSEGPKMLLKCPKIRDGLDMFRSHPYAYIQLSECRLYPFIWKMKCLSCQR